MLTLTAKLDVSTITVADCHTGFSLTPLSCQRYNKIRPTHLQNFRTQRPLPFLKSYEQFRTSRRHATQVTARSGYGPAAATATFQVGQAWVTPAAGRTQGVVHFLGGAFAGAAPQLVYELLIRLLSDAGFTVISTAYAVTFNHARCATVVHQAFEDSVIQLRHQLGRGYLVPESAPTFGVGHSNGALLHLLIGATCHPAVAGNVVISFNNKEVRDAIPVALDPLSEAVRSMRSSPLLSGMPISSTDLLRRAVQALSASPAALVVDEVTIAGLAPALDQLGSVFNEVGDGSVEFTPRPQESRALVRQHYRVPATLLVRFLDDAIDETPEMASILRGIPGIDVEELAIGGSHVTPCGADVNWQVGKSFSPTDAIALGFKLAAQADVRRMANRVANWLLQHC